MCTPILKAQRSLIFVLVFVGFFLVFFHRCAGPSLRLQDYPKPRRTLFLKHFTNQSFAPGVNRELGGALHRELRRQASFHLLNDHQDAYLWLSGEISSYQKLSMLPSHRADDGGHYKLRLSCWMKLQENPYKNGKKQKIEQSSDTNTAGRILLWQEFSARQIFAPNQGYRQTEAEALEHLTRKLAANISRSLEIAYVKAFRSKKEDNR